MKTLRSLLSLVVLVLATSAAHAQLTVEELAGLRTMQKMDAMQFLTQKGYKLDSCGAPAGGKKDVSSTCYYKNRRQADQKLQASEIMLSFGTNKKNHIFYTPFQPGYGVRFVTYMKTIKAKEDAFDNIQDHTYGKRFFQDGFTYDVAESTKKPGWEAITIYPTE